MPDTLAYEGSKKSAEVNRQKKGRRRKRKKFEAMKCEVLPDESQAKEKAAIEQIVEDISNFVKEGNVFDIEDHMEFMYTNSLLSLKSLDKLRRAILQRLSDDAKAAKEQASPKDDLEYASSEEPIASEEKVSQPE